MPKKSFFDWSDFDEAEKEFKNYDCDGICLGSFCDFHVFCLDDDNIKKRVDYTPLKPNENETFENFKNDLTINSEFIREGKNVPSRMRLIPKKDGGFHFGKMNHSDDFYVGKPQNEDGHIIIIGGPGSSKTSAMVIPSLESWLGHIVIIDVKPKGDLLECCYSTGKQVLVFNPYKNDACGFDPFAFIRSDEKNNLARNVKELALDLITLIPGGTDRVWVQSAQNLLAGIIAYHVNKDSTFSKAMEDIQLSPIKELIKTIKGSKNEIAQMFVSKLKGLKDETLAGIGMDFSDLAILAADPLVNVALSSEGKEKLINWHDLNTAITPAIYVLQLPEENLDAWEPMSKLLLNQLIRTLQRRPDKYSKEGNALLPVLIQLEEFASLGKINSIKSGLATLRSRNVTFSLVVQSLSQLDEIYGPTARRVIFDLCAYIVILKITDPESQKYCSELIGSLVVPNRSVSASYKTNGGTKNYVFQINETREPTIYPHEFALLNDVVIMTPDGYIRIKKVPYYMSVDEPLILLPQKKSFIVTEPLREPEKDVPYITST